MPIYTTTSGNFDYPRHDIDPELKGQEKWNLDVARYIYAYDLNSWMNKQRSKIQVLRDYASGDQDRDQYKKKYIEDEQNNNQSGASEQGPGGETEYLTLKEAGVGFTHIDFERIFSFGPLVVRAVSGILESQEHDVRVYAQDDKSTKQKQQLKNKMKAKMKIDPILKDVRPQENIPKTDEELEMYMALGGNMLDYEVGMQEVLNYTFTKRSDLKELKKRIIEDLVKIRMSAAVDVVDEYSQRVGIEYLDPSDLIIQYSDNNTRFEDIWFWGRQKLMTIGEVRKQTGWSEDKILNLAIKYNGDVALGNTRINSLTSIEQYSINGSANYNDVRVPVLEYEYKTVDNFYTSVLTRKNGTISKKEQQWEKDGYEAPKVWDDESRGRTIKTQKDDIVRWYKGSWVIGTDCIFNYGLKFDQAFDIKNREPRPSLHFYCMPDKSLIEQIIPLLDDCQMLWLRYQNDKAIAPPATGMAVEMGSLNEINMMGKKMRPYDTLKVYAMGGTLFYSMHEAVIPTGNGQGFNNVLPFKQLEGGIGKAVSDFVAGIQTNYQQISIITGVDAYTLSMSTPSSETTDTAIKSAMSATKDTIRPIYSGWISIQERLAMNTILVGQQLIVDNEDRDRGYYGIISDVKINAIKKAGKYPPAEYGFQTVALPSAGEIEKIENAAMMATQGGKNGIPALTYSEYLWICDQLKLNKPIKYIQAYISYKESKRDRESAEMAMQNQEANAKGALMQEEAKSKARLIEIDAQGKIDKELKMFEIIGKMVEKSGELNLKGINELKKIALQGGIDAGAMEAQMNPQMPGQDQGQAGPEQAMPMQQEEMPTEEMM